MFCETDSVSREEGLIAGKLAEILRGMGAEVSFDRAGAMVGGDTGNLVAKFAGTTDVEPIFLSGHMDTVEPGRGVRVVFEDRVFRSDGTTILGSDDKSALAIILEVMDVLLEKDLPRPPIEVVFTICEEIGLQGALHMDLSLVEAKIGYILDSTEVDGIVTNAPSSNHLNIQIHGRAAHAGAEPEQGISALVVASKAIAGLELGRIDHETTCNLGTISGGQASNIVPDFVSIQGEVRSHDEGKLERVSSTIVKAFQDAGEAMRSDGDELPRVEVEVASSYPATNIPKDHKVIKLAVKAAENLGRTMEPKTIGGGADANILFGKGLVAGVLGTGMTDVHTLKESIKLSDMENAAVLLLEIVRIHAAEEL